MLYESTRGSLHKKTGAQAVIRGIAEDKGLYVPEQIPALPFAPEAMIEKIKKGTAGYREVAQAVIGTFFDDFTEEEMGACIAGAYDKTFTARDIVEIKEAGGAHFLELYHGKTAAFKDMALSILPYLMTTACKKEGETSKICIPAIPAKLRWRDLRMCRAQRSSYSIPVMASARCRSAK